VGTGHPCFGCTEKGTAFHKPIHSLATVKTHTPPTAFPTVEGAKGWPADPAAVAIIAGIGGGWLALAPSQRAACAARPLTKTKIAAENEERPRPLTGAHSHAVVRRVAAGLRFAAGDAAA
jgi:hypothetical protein